MKKSVLVLGLAAIFLTSCGEKKKKEVEEVAAPEVEVVEEVEVAGNHLVDRIKALVQDRNARRVVIRGSDGHEIMTIPLTLGVVAGGLIT